MAPDSVPATAHVTTPSGRVVGIPDGTRLVFGRGADADLVIPAGRGLSRRAGAISAAAGGAWVANLSKTHALYAEGDGYRIRLPRLDETGEPSAGWFVQQGTALVGSRAMLDEGQPLRLVVVSRAMPGEPDADAARLRADGDATLLPLYLDPNTKLFLVALDVVPAGCSIRPAARRCRARRRSPAPRWRPPTLITRSSASTVIRPSATGCRPGSASISRCSAARSSSVAWSVRHPAVRRGRGRAADRDGTIAAADLARLSDPAWCAADDLAAERSTSSHSVEAVPPVASRSSWTSTRAPVRDRVGVQLEQALAVLEGVLGADRLVRELAGLAGQDEAGAELQRRAPPRA